MQGKLKRTVVCLLVVTAVLLLCACQPEEEIVYRITNQKTDEDVIKEEGADAYLREHDYSEEFITSAGLATKEMLVTMGAAYQTSTGEVIGSNDELWQDFGAAITVSDASMLEEGLSVKVIIYQWQWAGEHLAEGDSLLFAWSSSYSLLPEYALFELYGTGSLQPETSSFGDEAFPQQAEGSFVVQSAMKDSAYYTDDMLFTIQGGMTLAYDITVDAGSMFRSIRSDTYADYSIDTGNYSGSFSIVLVQQCEKDFANIAVTYQQNGIVEGKQSVCEFYAYLSA